MSYLTESEREELLRLRSLSTQYEAGIAKREETLQLAMRLEAALVRFRDADTVDKAQSLAREAIKATRVHHYGSGLLHDDDRAVLLFAWRMRDKMRQSRENGRAGWSGARVRDIVVEMVDHMWKANTGCYVDIGNYAMMLDTLCLEGRTTPQEILDIMRSGGQVPQ